MYFFVYLEVKYKVAKLVPVVLLVSINTFEQQMGKNQKDEKKRNPAYGENNLWGRVEGVR